VYEAHIGAFTAEGTLRAAISKLDHLAALGVTATAMTPIANFSGRWNWATMAYCCTRRTAPTAGQKDLKGTGRGARVRELMVMLDDTWLLSN